MSDWNSYKIITVTLLAVIAGLLAYQAYYYASDDFAYNIQQVAKFCKDDKGGLTAACDPVAMAYQLGRLDFVSVCIAVLGVSVGLSTIVGFFGIKERSEFLAVSVAKEKIASFDETFEAKLKSLEEETRVLVRKEVRELKEAGIKPQTKDAEDKMLQGMLGEDDE
ncbi:hypothetical protein LH715_004077 [Vibrio vulnificus]|nr:hypothetical protein [Vibrio vulnificus]